MRWPRDSNPRGGRPPTRSPGVPLSPLGQATATESTGARRAHAERSAGRRVEDPGLVDGHRAVGLGWTAVEPKAEMLPAVPTTKGSSGKSTLQRGRPVNLEGAAGFGALSDRGLRGQALGKRCRSGDRHLEFEPEDGRSCPSDTPRHGGARVSRGGGVIRTRESRSGPQPLSRRSRSSAPARLRRGV